MEMDEAWAHDRSLPQAATATTMAKNLQHLCLDAWISITILVLQNMLEFGLDKNENFQAVVASNARRMGVWGNTTRNPRHTNFHPHRHSNAA